MATTVEDRAIFLLSFVSESLDTKHGFWTELGKASGIETARWRKIFNRRQRITSDMLEALSLQYPQYAFWLVTGITDALNGHIAPKNAQTFPEPTFSWTAKSSSEYFLASIDLLKQLYANANINLNNDHERYAATERKLLNGNWWDSPLLDVAQHIVKSTRYQDLKNIHDERELARQATVGLLTSRPAYKHTRDNILSKMDEMTKDPRTQHQNKHSLFYIPIPDDNQKS
jgi:hypothetical protein